MAYLKQIKITRIEERTNDAWYDINMRQMRTGEVRFYRVRDFLTGEWLFKLCRDEELGKVLIKALKCPPGVPFAQLEGNTMVFQKSAIEGWLYDIISLTQASEKEQLARKVVDEIQEIPAIIRENYQVKTYEEATGKAAPGKHWATLSKVDDEKGMIDLFLLERAWTLSFTTPEEKIKTLEEQERQKPRERRKEIDTGQTWTCPVCGDEFRLKHIERETTTIHTLKKS
jgi:rubrerythrin